MIRQTSDTRHLVLLLILLVPTVVPTSFGHIGYSQKELKHALRKLQVPICVHIEYFAFASVANSHWITFWQPEQLHALLVASGYTKASLGDKLVGMVMEPNSDTEALKTGVTFPTDCGTVYMHDFPDMQVQLLDQERNLTLKLALTPPYCAHVYSQSPWVNRKAHTHTCTQLVRF